MMKMTKQAVITAILLFFSVLLFELSKIDILVQDYLYDFGAARWVLDRDEVISKFVFYDGIKIIIICFVLMLFVIAVFFKHSHFVQNHKTGILIVLFSAVMVPLTVGALKAITNIPCPRDLTHYGGIYPHITLFMSYPQDFFQYENIKCYPAGHASGGFALLSLLFLVKKKSFKIMTAILVLSIGWAMGIYKMLIGDHFLSHTVITMILSWLIILIVAQSVYFLTNRSKDIS